MCEEGLRREVEVLKSAGKSRHTARKSAQSFEERNACVLHTEEVSGVFHSENEQNVLG